MTIILSLVGEQTIPVVQLIRALPQAAEYWFVDTEKTREQACVTNICAACKLPPQKVKTLSVNPEALAFTPPADWKIPEDARLYLNLTGGTKPMMLSVYRAYENHPATHPYYIPLARQDQAQPLKNGQPAIPLSEPNLETYLTAHGFSYTFDLPENLRAPAAKALFRKVIEAKGPQNVPEIFAAGQPHIQPPDKKWLSGDWWEHYLYDRIRHELNLPESQIARNVKLLHRRSKSRTDSDNELDAVFVYQNRLYLVEGKVYSGKVNASKINPPIYKLSSQLRTLGIQSAGILCFCATTGNNPEQKKRLGYLENMFGIRKVLLLEDFKQPDVFRKLFNLK